ncbi:MAG TPA: ferrochelatase [Rudaea sp.]|jgi:ferrochelatase
MTSLDPAPVSATDVVLLVNLGTPEAPTPAAVRRYLAEFLSDPRVIDAPRWWWLPILYGVILNVRPRRSARAYARIWTERGSPLRVYSESLAEQLDLRVRALSADRMRVVLAMRYGQPSIGATVERLYASGLRRLLLLPLYPQYSGTSTGTAVDALAAAVQRLHPAPEMRHIDNYHDDPGHISALAENVEKFWKSRGRAPKLLLSFHGIPQRYVRNGDPYFDQCCATAQHLRARLQMHEDDLLVAFQSRLGREPWLQPYTEQVLAALPGQGIEHIQVLCPGFAVDCLETLEEIALRDRDLFVASGGKRLDYIPALNDSPAHVDVLLALIRRNAAGWFAADAAAASAFDAPAA